MYIVSNFTYCLHEKGHPKRIQLHDIQNWADIVQTYWKGVTANIKIHLAFELYLEIFSK